VIGTPSHAIGYTVGDMNTRRTGVVLILTSVVLLSCAQVGNVSVTGELYFFDHPFSCWAINPQDGDYDYLRLGGENAEEIIEHGEGSLFKINGIISEVERLIPQSGEFNPIKETLIEVDSYEVLFSFNDEMGKLQTEVDNLSSEMYQDYIDLCNRKRPELVSALSADLFVIDCYSYAARKLSTTGSVGCINICEQITDSIGVNYEHMVYDCLANLNASRIEICEACQKVEANQIYEHSKTKAVSACYRRVAFNRNDPTLCKKASNLYQYGYCYIDLAVLNNDPTICGNIKYEGGVPSYRDTCYKETASDIETCNNIGQSYSTDWIVEEMANQSSLTYAVATRKKYECYLLVAIRNGDESICNEIPEGEIREECYEHFE